MRNDGQEDVYRYGLDFYDIRFFAGLLLGGLAVSVYPLPFPDKGHRLFEARNEAAAKTLVEILEKNGLRKNWAFDAGPSHQIVMDDGVTVIAWFDEDAGDLPKNTISLAVENPYQRDPREDNFVDGWTQRFRKTARERLAFVAG